MKVLVPFLNTTVINGLTCTCTIFLRSKEDASCRKEAIPELDTNTGPDWGEGGSLVLLCPPE